MDAGPVDQAVALLRAAVDGLLNATLSAQSSVEMTSLLTAVERERRRLEAVDQRMLAEVAGRGIAGDYARCSPAELLVTMLRVAPSEAKARVARARDLAPRHSVVGEPLPPILPAAAAAVAAGEISGQHASVITRCIEHIPLQIAHEAAPVAERMLVEAARHEHPAALAKTAQLLLMRLDPDGAEPRDAELERKRAFGLSKFGDGSSTPRGHLTPDVTAALETILDALSAPLPTADGMPDERTPAQRRHDALGEAAMRLLRSDGSDALPAAGGVPVTILATVTLQELVDKAGVATTAHGDPWSVQQLLTIACEAQVVPVIFNDAGGILAFGRTRRLASKGQRLALVARDGGCCFPNCERPAAWAEVHHIHEWLDGGDTDNMCLLCRFHHREFEKRGWQVVMSADGLPEWVPPPFIDQDRKPVRNTAHHQRDLTFTA